MWRIFEKYLLSWNNFTRINAIKLKERTCSILQYLQDPDDDLEKTRKYFAIKDNPTRAPLSNSKDVEKNSLYRSPAFILVICNGCVV